MLCGAGDPFYPCPVAPRNGACDRQVPCLVPHGTRRAADLTLTCGMGKFRSWRGSLFRRTPGGLRPARMSCNQSRSGTALGEHDRAASIPHCNLFTQYPPYYGTLYRILVKSRCPRRSIGERCRSRGSSNGDCRGSKNGRPRCCTGRNTGRTASRRFIVVRRVS